MPLLLAYGSRKTLVLTLCGTMLLSGYLWAEQTTDPPDVKALLKREIGTRLYLEQIQPLLEKNCLGCHSTTTKQTGLDLSSRQGLLKGGKHGPAVVPGNSKSSLLFGLITHSQQPAMPPQGQKIPAQATALIGLWIDLGAPYGLLDSEKDIGLTDESSGALAATRDDHFAKVRSILETKCLHCHGGKFRQAGLDLSGRERILQGSDEHTDVVVPGDPGASLLVKKVRHQHEPGMPYQGQQLSEDEIRNLVAWVDAGAPYSRGLSTASADELKSPLPGSSDHWAYQAPTRPDPPQVENQAWLRNPIDTFLAAEHERLSLEPMPEAPKRTLLRRLYLDLTGLPPTPDQLRSFLEDRSDRAFERVVDQLLESPHYGERWGRHWMDVWRYSDWYGLRGFGLVQNSQRHLWHWRDWIIESLNEDKSYDRMILEMLAGDELAPTDPKTLRATGYLVRNWFGPNRNAWLRETVEHAASGFLATTLKCARCHDHKTDPIAQEEYYRFRAFFERHDVRTDPLPGEPDILKAGMPRAFDSEPRAASRTGPAIFAETYRFIRGDEKNPDTTNPLSPAVPEILGTLGEKIEPVELPQESYLPSIRPFVHRDLLRQAQEEIETAEAESAEAKQQVVLAQRRASEESNPTTLKAGRETFEKEIKPIFDKHCIVCHGPNVARNDFRPLTFDLLLEGGTRGGPGIIPGKSSISSVIRRLRGDKQPRMPAEAPPLPRKVIDRIADWVDGLQPEDPQLALRQAQEALEISDKKLAWKRENVPALEARLIADRARHAEPPDPRAADYAEVARRAERSATLLKAEMNLLEAQQRLADAL